MLRTANIIIVTALIALAGYVAAGPYITIYQIEAAVEAEDPDKLARQIEFKELRQSFKNQINRLMMPTGEQRDSYGSASVFATGLMSVFTEKMIDMYITPEGIAAIMQGEKLQPGKTASAPTMSGDMKKIFKQAEYEYQSHDHFLVSSTNKNGERTRFVLKRYGIDWKLARVKIPFEPSGNP